MTKIVQHRRGTTAEVAGITGAAGELFVDTSKVTVVVMDGITQGGAPLATETNLNSLSSSVSALSSNVSIFLNADTTTVTVGAGTVSAPALTTTGDSNTGIYFPAADIMALVTNGADAMRINSSGNVGIVTTGPIAKLHIKAGTSTSVNFAQENTNGGTDAKIIEWVNDWNNYSLKLINDDYTSAHTAYTLNRAGFTVNSHIWYTSSSLERMRIDSAGNVGIGTTSPTNFGSNFKMLAVQGSDFGVIQGISSSGATTIEMMGASGIGYVGTRTNHPLALRTNDTEHMRIDTSGNVGIGTATPNFRASAEGRFLAVAGSSASGGVLELVNTNTDGTGNYSTLTFIADGNTSTSRKAIAQVEAYTTGTVAGNRGGQLVFVTKADGGTAVERMSIDNAGNVGIGTSTTGTYKLLVTGLISDTKGDVRAAPIQAKTSAYVLVATDAGQTISITTGGVTVNASVFNAGDMISIFNNSGSSQNITQGTNVTLRLTGTATTGTRALAQYGIATLLCVVGGANPVFACTGSGLT